VQHETWSKLARVRDRLGKTKEADAARANAERILQALGRKPAEIGRKPSENGSSAQPAAPANDAAPAKDAKP
jgi:predicted Zn-dependent protease